MKQALILIAMFIVVANLPELKALMAGDIEYDPAVAGEVTLYSTSWCGYCKKTRTFFEKNNIPYTEHDIEKSSKGMRQMAAMAAHGVPVVVVGDTVIRGYQPSALAKALNAKQ